MKKKIKFLSVLLFAAIGFVSCDNDDNNNVQTQRSIAQIASNNPNLSTLVSALNRTGLTATLAGQGTFTVFAPTNQAFDTFLSDNNFQSLDDVPNDLLKEVLLNHVLSDEVFSNQIATGYVSTMAKGDASSTNYLSMYLNTSNGVTINGVSDVIQADVNASNGVVHVVDAVIGLPNVVTHALANPNFEVLVSALTRNDQPDFVGILSGSENSPFTVFAPTNQAFTNLLTEYNWNGLSDIPQSVLENTLKYHVVANSNVQSTMLSDDMMVTTFQGQSFTVNLDGGATITDSNSRVSNIIATDVQCSNGIIHVLDKVIVPNLQ